MKNSIRFVLLLLLMFVLQACNSDSKDLSITVLFDSQGGSNVESIVVDTKKFDGKFETPTKTGYTFDNWYTNLSFQELFDYDFENIKEVEITLYAKWTINSYTLTLIDGQAETVETIPFNTDLSNKEVSFAKDGHVFIGWFTDVNHSALYMLNTMPANDLTLYGKWEKQSYYLTFLDYDQTFIHQVSIPYDDFLEDSYLNAPTRIGYTFNGWDIDLPNKMPNHNITAVATYLINRYTVSFETYQGTVFTSLQLDFDTEFTVSEPTLLGYEFLGWYLDEAFFEPFTTYKVPANDIKLYAKWEKLPYHITFDTQGAPSIDDLIVLYLDPIDLPIPTQQGYEFLGWYIDLDNNIMFDLEVMPANHIHLIAKWSKVEYEVSYYLLGGTNHPDNPLSIDGS